MSISTDFWQIANRVFTAHEQGHYRDALDLANDAAGRFPDRAEMIAYWEACAHARLGNPAKALASLQDGLRRGLWWSPDMLRRDPDLEPIRHETGFDAIVGTCEDRLGKAQPAAVPGLETYPPNRPAPASPLLIALHWRMRHLADFAPWWLPASERGVLVAIPRSSQQVAMNGFGWDDRARATREITESYDQLRATGSFDANRVILAGASQGGAVALEIALSGDPLPARGFIAVVPAIHDLDALLSSVEQAVRRGVRGWVVTGERDYGRDSAIALGERLNRVGIPTQVDVVPDLGHDFPGDFDARLPAAIAYVLAS